MDSATQNEDTDSDFILSDHVQIEEFTRGISKGEIQEWLSMEFDEAIARTVLRELFVCAVFATYRGFVAASDNRKASLIKSCSLKTIFTTGKGDVIAKTGEIQ